MDGSSYTAAEAENRLGVSEPTRQRLARMGLLVPEQVGRKRLYSASEVDRWASAKPAPAESALIVRLGLEGQDDDGRKIGWGADYSQDERREAARKWWRIAQPETLIGSPLVAAVSDWALEAWVISGALVNSWGFSEFELEEDEEVSARWRGTRLYIPNGIVGAFRWPLAKN